MNRRSLLVAVPAIALFGCSSAPSTQFLSDAQLTLTMFNSVVQTVAMDPKASPGLINNAVAVLGTLQTALNDLKAGVKTPSDYAKVATDVLNGVKGPILAAMSANPDIVLAVNLAVGLLPVLAADIEAQNGTPTQKATLSDGRARAKAYLAERGK
jgi:hypothetical protein